MRLCENSGNFLGTLLCLIFIVQSTYEPCFNLLLSCYCVFELKGIRKIWYIFVYVLFDVEMEMSDFVVKVNIILISKNISVVLNNSLGLKNTVRTLLTVPPPIVVSFNKADKPVFFL